jgi:hypothetical protein
MPAIGKLLVDDGICTYQQIDDAVRNQVIMGGRIGTNLVELGVLDEETLARYLSRVHELPAMSGENIQPEEQALSRIPADVVDRLNIIPFIMEPKRIQVLCVDPRDVKALDEVAFITGLTPDPIVVPEIRFWQLLRDFYGIEREMRFVALDTRDYLGGSYGYEEPPPAPTVSEDLIGEDSFIKLYQRRDGFPQISSPGEPSVPPQKMPLLTDEDLEVMEEDGPPGQIERRVWKPSLVEGGRRREDRALADRAAAPPSQPPGFEDDDTPLNLAQASRMLSEVSERNAIARVVLRFAHSLFKRSMIFTIHRGVALGWDAIGEDIDRWAFRSVMIPLDSPSVFQLVVNARAHYLGGMHKTKTNIEFLRATGKKVPYSACLLPVLVRGRVVNILYCDNGHKEHSSDDIGDLLILAQRISQCYESLFEQKRAQYREKIQKE